MLLTSLRNPFEICPRDRHCCTRVRRLQIIILMQSTRNGVCFVFLSLNSTAARTIVEHDVIVAQRRRDDAAPRSERIGARDSRFTDASRVVRDEQRRSRRVRGPVGLVETEDVKASVRRSRVASKCSRRAYNAQAEQSKRGRRRLGRRGFTLIFHRKHDTIFLYYQWAPIDVVIVLQCERIADAKLSNDRCHVRAQKT